MLDGHSSVADDEPDRAVAVGPVGGGDGPQGRERGGRRVAVRVAAADLDHGDAGMQPGQLAGHAGVGAAVMGDLERLDGRKVEGGGDVGLGVGREQQVEGAGTQVGDDRALVRILAGMIFRRLAARPQDVQLEGPRAQGLARVGREATDAATGSGGHHGTVQREIQAGLHEQAVGRVESVLVDSRSRRRDWELSGRTSGNTVVNFTGDGTSIGKLVPVRITSANPNSLRGEIVAAEPRRA